MAELWRYITGNRGVSRVRVYERRPDAPLQIEWYENGRRRQRSLRSFTGKVIRDTKIATRIADEFSDQLEQDYNRGVRRHLWGIGEPKSLGKLLERLHDDRGSRWSKSHERDQDRYREWWEMKLGTDVVLTDVNDAMVETVVRREGKDREWSPRTEGAYLRYIVDAFYYAERKLKWIEPRHNLSSVDIPAPRPKGKPYSKAEVGKLLPKLEAIDPIAGWIGHVLWQTGRRLTAVRTLPRSAVELHEDLAVITWPEETDKPRKGGVSVVVGEAFALTKRLLEEKSGKYVTGRSAPDMDTCQDWMNLAEQQAGVPHVKGRSWHGIKRRYSDRTEGMKSRAAQSGTREDTLRRKYDPRDDLAAMREVAEALASEVRTA